MRIFRLPLVLSISVGLAIFFPVVYLLAILFAKDEWTRLVLSDILSCISISLVPLATWYSIQHTKNDPTLQRAWWFILIANVANMIGEVIWTTQELVFKVEIFPSFADLFYLAFYPFAILGIFLLPRPQLSWREKLKSTLDIGVIVLSGIIVFWNFIIGPILFTAGENATWFETAVSLAYPVFDLALLWALFSALIQLLGRYNRWPVVLLAIGISIQTISDSVYSYRVLMGTYTSGGLIDISWLLAYSFLGLAAVAQAVYPRHQAAFIERDPLQVHLGGGQVYLPFLWMGMAYFILLWSFQHTLVMATFTLAVGVGLMLLLLIARQVVAFRENRRLTYQLQVELGERKLTAQKLKSQKERFEKLVEVAFVTTSSKSLGECLQNALRISLEITNAERGSLFMINDAGEAIRGILARGDTITGHITYVKRIMDEGLAGWVYRNQKPVIIPDVLEDDRWLVIPNPRFPVRSVLAVPINLGKKTLGVLTVHDPKVNHFTQDHLQFMLAAAQQMALALQNANILEEQLRLTAELKQARDVADDLLLNILPSPIAARLKAGETVIADYCPNATVLFADLVDFTPFAGMVTPVDLVNTLNLIFSKFDDVVEKQGVEKIKTSGDAYIVAAGLNKAHDRHVRAIAETALEMLAIVRELQASHQIPCKVRIGIHKGPVIAGIIGKHKFSYDMWGDTVNIASRMESQGMTNAIQVSQVVYDMLCGQYEFEERGLISVKGKGDMRAYLLTGRKAGYKL